MSQFRRVAIRGAQPSARLSEEICLSEGSAGVFERALRGLSDGSAGSLRSSAGVRGIFRGFSGVVTLCLWPSGAVGENGTLDPSSLDLRFWGAPIFSPEDPKPCFEVFSSEWGKNLGRPRHRSNDDGSKAPFSAL